MPLEVRNAGNNKGLVRKFNLDKYSQKRNEHEFFQFQRYGIYRILKLYWLKSYYLKLNWLKSYLFMKVISLFI